MKTKNLVLASLLSIALFVGCNSNESTDSANSAISSEDAVVDSEIDASVDDVSLIVEDQFAVQQSLTTKVVNPVKSILPDCATVTSVLTNDTYTRTIDFGTAGCAMANGNVLKGKIIISFSKSATTAAKTISYSLVGFYHNNKLVEGNKTIVREVKSTNALAEAHPVVTHSVEVKITYPDGKTYTRTGNRIREMIEGYATTDVVTDNVFLVSGSNSTTFPDGSIFSSTIKTPLHIVMGCKNPIPVSGVITIVKKDKEATIDYGNGTCDLVGTLTVNGVTKEIKLRK